MQFVRPGEAGKVAPFEPSRICAVVSLVSVTPLLLRKVTICWPVASLTMFALVRLRNARFSSPVRVSPATAAAG